MDKSEKVDRWWTPVSAEDFFENRKLNAIPEDRAVEPSSLPEKPWKAGQARPVGALSLSSSEASTVGALAMMGMWCAAARGGGVIEHPNAVETTAVVLALNLIQPVSAGLQTWSERQWGVAGAALGAKTALVHAGAMFVGAGAVLAALPRLVGQAGRGALSKAGLMAPPSTDRTGRLSAFAELLDKTATGMTRRVKVLREDSVEGLTDIGAWRMARQRLLDNQPVAAVNIWMARPFNPSWTMRMGSKADGRPSSFRGETLDFVSAIEKAAGRRSAREAAFLRDAAASMRAASEQLQLRETLGSDAVGAQGNEAKGEKAPAVRAARL